MESFHRDESYDESFDPKEIGELIDLETTLMSLRAQLDTIINEIEITSDPVDKNILEQQKQNIAASIDQILPRYKELIDARIN